MNIWTGHRVAEDARVSVDNINDFIGDNISPLENYFSFRRRRIRLSAFWIEFIGLLFKWTRDYD